jgi:hypothetical protein
MITASYMDVDFFVAGFGQRGARAFARQAERLGFTVELCSEVFAGDWMCVCTKSMPPTSEDLSEVRSELDRLSAPLGGRSEGWGVGAPW